MHTSPATKHEKIAYGLKERLNYWISAVFHMHSWRNIVFAQKQCSKEIYRDLCILYLLQRQREYLFVGGMPEAIDVFCQTKSLCEVARVQTRIVEMYEDDFAKYTSSSEEHRQLQRVYRYVAKAAGTKIKYSNITREERSPELKLAVERLLLAEVIH